MNKSKFMMILEKYTRQRAADGVYNHLLQRDKPAEERTAQPRIYGVNSFEFPPTLAAEFVGIHVDIDPTQGEFINQQN